MNKWIKTGLAVSISASLLTGCSFGKSESTNEQAKTLKVMFYDESYFYSQFGMLYTALHPNVEFDIVSTNSLYRNITEDKSYEDLLNELIEQEKPDILMLNATAYTLLGEEGKLYDIESFVNEEKYNAAGLAPGIIDTMKAYGNGKLYGLPTSFQSQVIYYNKDLFDKHNVPYPTDQMTWAEVIELAKMFPTEGDPRERVYGLQIGWSRDLYQIVDALARGENLQMFNPDTLQMTIDTPAWNKLTEMAVSIMNSNYLYSESDMNNDDVRVYNMDYYSSDPFFAGRLAMKLESSYLIHQLENLDLYTQNPDDLIQNWDIVTAPVSSDNREESQYTFYYDIFAINNSSANIEAAWDFISYITGDDYARVKSKVTSSGLPMRTAYLPKNNERNYEAFYKIRPSLQTLIFDSKKIPQAFQEEFYMVMYTELDKVKAGQATVAEALSAIQIKGNELLSQPAETSEEKELDEGEGDVSINAGEGEVTEETGNN